MEMNSSFRDLSPDDMMVTDGGFFLSTGAMIGLALFGGGVALGLSWAFCD